MPIKEEQVRTFTAICESCGDTLVAYTKEDLEAKLITWIVLDSAATDLDGNCHIDIKLFGKGIQLILPAVFCGSACFLSKLSLD